MDIEIVVRVMLGWIAISLVIAIIWSRFMGHIRQHDERRIEALEAYRAAHGDSAAETGDIPPAALKLSRAGSRPARSRARLA